MSNSLKKIVRAGVVGGLYIALSMITFSISSGAIQFRPAEALTLLPLLFPETAIGLFVGCFFTNLITGCTPWDMVLGSIITLLAGVLTAFTGKAIKQRLISVVVGGLFPVLLNAFLLPLIWLYMGSGLEYVYIIQCLLLIASQSLSVYALGIPLSLSLAKLQDRSVKIFTD